MRQIKVRLDSDYNENALEERINDFTKILYDGGVPEGDISMQFDNVVTSGGVKRTVVIHYKKELDLSSEIT